MGAAGLFSGTAAGAAEEVKTDTTTVVGDAVEPNLGDLGLLETESQRVAGGNEVDEDEQSNIRAERSNLNVRDS